MSLSLERLSFLGALLLLFPGHLKGWLVYAFLGDLLIDPDGL